MVQSMLVSILGGAASIRITRMDQGHSTWVYRVERGTERFYLRILPEEEDTYAPEVRAHELAREAGARVPEVLHYEARNAVVDRSIMLTSEIAGRPLTDQVPLDFARDVILEAGRDLARINSIPVDGWGWISRDDESIPTHLNADDPDLFSMLEREYFPQSVARYQDFLEPIELRRFDNFLSQIPMLIDGSESRLVHGDFDISHIYCDDAGYTGIIDFGEIRGMPSLYDLGHHWMHDQERLPYSTLPWLLTGYTEIAPLPDNCQQQIVAWSLLIALRSLNRGRARNPNSLIVRTSRAAIQRDINEIKGL